VMHVVGGKGIHPIQFYVSCLEQIETEIVALSTSNVKFSRQLYDIVLDIFNSDPKNIGAIYSDSFEGTQRNYLPDFAPNVTMNIPFFAKQLPGISNTPNYYHDTLVQIARSTIVYHIPLFLTEIIDETQYNDNDQVERQAV